MRKRSSHDNKDVIDYLYSLKIPFSGTTIADKKRKYHVSPFPQISISGIGPVFYRDKKSGRIFTLLQRRFKDNFQWWFPGGYVELPPAQHGIFATDFEKIKNATIDEYYKNAISYGCWQKAKKEINDKNFITKSLKKHGVKWPKEIDFNWLSAWQREVLEETGVDLEKFPKKITTDFKINHNLMIGAERDRLTNIDGKFCAFLGDLTKAPATKPDEETEELRWIALDEISFNKTNFFAHKKIVNLYTVTLIEEALFEIICTEIKRISQIKNPITNQQISRFNNPQNLQAFIFDQSQNRQISKLKNLQKFLSWEFGDLEIGRKICGRDGDDFYRLSIKICEFLSSQRMSSELDLPKLDQLLRTP